MNVVFDIETGPLPPDQLEHARQKLKPHGSLKDPVKVAADLEAKWQTLLERAALDATTGRVVAGGFLVNHEFTVEAHDDEPALLRAVWKRMSSHFYEGDRFIGFNIFGFDVPFLMRRSMVLGVPAPTWLPRNGRYPAPTFTDLLEVWRCGDRQEFISLDSLARLCGLPGKSGSGADFAMLLRHDREAALRYLRTDLELTRDLALRMIGDGSPNDEGRL